jgi:hypothetical protein
VDNLAGYARRNFLVPVPGVNSFQELNALLRERCLAEAKRRLQGETLTVGELWDEDRPHLLPLPARPFPFSRRRLKCWQSARMIVGLPSERVPLSLMFYRTDREPQPNISDSGKVGLT